MVSFAAHEILNIVWAVSFQGRLLLQSDKSKKPVERSISRLQTLSLLSCLSCDLQGCPFFWFNYKLFSLLQYQSNFC